MDVCLFLDGVKKGEKLVVPFANAFMEVEVFDPDASNLHRTITYKMVDTIAVEGGVVLYCYKQLVEK